jgi:tRNA A22 N-methylase
MKVTQLRNLVEALNWCNDREVIFLGDDGETYDIITVEYNQEEDTVYLKGEHT